LGTSCFGWKKQNRDNSIEQNDSRLEPDAAEKDSDFLIENVSDGAYLNE
jgi:hypothetical protein